MSTDRPGDAPESPEPVSELAPMDFSVLVLSLRASTMMQLGQGLDHGKPLPVDLPMAQQNIAMLLVLDEKTRGNLSGDEERLLSQVLFELRMEYATVVGKPGK